MKTSIKIITIFGIPIELDISFLILILFIYSLVFLQFIPIQLAILITLVFITVIIHELSHSYMAQRYGVNIEKIVLLPIGGVAQMGEIPHNPRQELIISAVGPLTNVIIAIVSYIIYLGIKSYIYPLISTFILDFTIVNIFLAIFNMIPAFPMDGGRILRAILAEKMDYIRATEISASIGKILAIFMAAAGIFVNVFLIVIGLFIYIGAEQEYRATVISSTLSGIKVSDIMTKEVKTLHPNITVDEALEKMFQYKHMGYPIANEGKLLGIITFHDLSNVEKGNRNILIKDIMSTDLITCKEDDEVISALESITKNDLGRLPVISQGKLVGIISKTDIVNILNLLRKKNK
ncbi:CBS domain-containing protein [Methanobacterium alcaliphilum]|uniref:CBS domain-containing protein n=1 Tax=Methanobacterium alcaliphilum TaxID=392018 RepID=UPI00200A77CD|nr:CBS domain-containing protein [Methanobacterium alcaliphilum]MCK9150884.1 CBS domain-containing protein [Methanobacterium alcaliphilum]